MDQPNRKRGTHARHGYDNYGRRAPKALEAFTGDPDFKQKPAASKDPGPWVGYETARNPTAQAHGRLNKMPVGYTMDARYEFGSNPTQGITEDQARRGIVDDYMGPQDPMYTNEPPYGGYQNMTGEPDLDYGFVERNNYLDRL